MEIKLDNEQLQRALDAAVLNAIGDTGREQIIKAVVESLTRVKGGYGYGSDKTPLMQILEDVAKSLARKLLEKKLENDPVFVENVEKLYAHAAQKMFSVENREKLVEKLATAMSDALTKDRY